MKAFSQFYDDLLPLVTGCPTAMADHALKRAVREWCDRTLCWRDWLADVTTLADENNYDFEVQATQEVVQVLRATLDGAEVDVLSPDNLPTNWRTADWCDRAAIVTTDGVSFTLVPMPSAGQTVAVEVALRPSDTATTVEDFIHARYCAQIAKGAAARLHAMPGKPYTYPASTARAEFESDIARVASEVAHAFSRTPLRVRASFL